MKNYCSPTRINNLNSIEAEMYNAPNRFKLAEIENLEPIAFAPRPSLHEQVSNLSEHGPKHNNQPIE